MYMFPTASLRVLVEMGQFRIDAAHPEVLQTGCLASPNVGFGAYHRNSLSCLIFPISTETSRVVSHLGLPQTSPYVSLESSQLSGRTHVPCSAYISHLHRRVSFPLLQSTSYI